MLRWFNFTSEGRFHVIQWNLSLGKSFSTSSNIGANQFFSSSVYLQSNQQTKFHVKSRKSFSCSCNKFINILQNCTIQKLSYFFVVFKVIRFCELRICKAIRLISCSFVSNGFRFWLYFGACQHPEILHYSYTLQIDPLQSKYTAQRLDYTVIAKLNFFLDYKPKSSHESL